MIANGNSPSEVTRWQLVMLVLSIMVLLMLAYETFAPTDVETRRIFELTDNIVCAVFIADFFGRLATAKQKRRFIAWNWIDLASSIPIVDALRVGRLIRIFRVLRILRAFRSTKLLVTFIFRNRAQGTFASVALISFVVWFFASVAILHFENGPEANIRGAEDALWWAFVTITTVGYGDKYPVSEEGRIIAAILMTVGVGLFGTFTGYIATFFMESKKETEEKQNSELDAIRNELEMVKSLLFEIRNTQCSKLSEEVVTPASAKT